MIHRLIINNRLILSEFFFFLSIKLKKLSNESTTVQCNTLKVSDSIRNNN